MWRSRAAVVAVAAVLTSAVGAWPADAGVPTTAAAAGGLDLNDPDAGITDPVRNFPVLDRNCDTGQVDVNRATVAEIAEGFGLASSPTVDRIVAMRPWLTPGDLVSVPGVPPEILPELEAGGCATPLTIPEPAPLACTATTQVDLQVASAATIARRLAIPRVTADAIVAHRPVPQNLYQLVAPRTAGLGADRIRQLLLAGRVCVTPPPSTYSGTDYRFVYPASGGTVTAIGDPDYALIVPPGVLNQATVIEVTPVAGEVLPTADVHIYGTFAGEVAVRLPDISTGEPMVLHDAADGIRVSWGDGAVSSNGTVVSAATSLSEFSASDRDLICSTALEYSMSISCTGTDPRDEYLALLIEYAAAATAHRMESLTSSLPRGECTESEAVLISEGSTPPGFICSASRAGSSSTWSFENGVTSVIVDGWIENFGAVYRVNQTGAAPGHTFATTPGTSPTTGQFSGPVARYLADSHDLVVAGHALNYVKNAGDPSTSVTASGARALVYTLVFGLLNISSVLDAGAAIANLGGTYNLALCQAQIASALNGGSVGDAIGCAKNLADALLTNAAARIGGSTGQALLAVKATLGKLFLGIQVSNFGAAVISQLATGGTWNDQTLSFQQLTPPPPVGGGGGSGQPGDDADPGDYALDGTGNFIARDGSTGESWLVGIDNEAHPILNGNTFLCYATRYVVVDYVNSYYVGGTRRLRLNPDTDVVAEPAPSCLSTPFITWNYQSPDVGGNTPYDVILRGQFDGTTHPSWLINSAGEIQTIPSGGDYICLTSANPVIWNVDFDHIQAWPEVGTTPASCG